MVVYNRINVKVTCNKQTLKIIAILTCYFKYMYISLNIIVLNRRWT